MTTFSLKQMHGIAQQKLPLDTPNPLRTKNGVALPAGRTNIENVSPEFYFSPNPYLGDLVDPLNFPKSIEEPYQQNISSGKNTYVYDAHTYHTKVPPKGIELLIDYYTRPGDVVLDVFCGSGMTGVAAIEKERKALLCDVSPAATFIAYNLATPVDAKRYMDAIRSMLEITSALEQKFIY